MKAVPLLVAVVLLPLAEQRSELEESLRALASDVRALERTAVVERSEDLLELEPALGDRLRADVHYARGLVLALDPVVGEDGVPDPDSPRLARGDFQSARALAGPGSLRLDATYNLAWIDLAAAEAWYQRIPEVAGGAAGQAGDGGEAPDPLEEARQRYLAARKGFVRRLRLDWRDEDTRANLEWIQRRLHELEAIEKQREEQQDPEESQENEENQDSDQEQEPQEGESDPDEGADENRESSPDSEQEENQDEPSPSEDEADQDAQEGEPSAQDPADAEPDGAQEEQSAGEEELPEGEPQPDQSGAEEAPPERVLTREEAMRLLDRLRELEEEGERVRASLRQSRRVPVERDW